MRVKTTKTVYLNGVESLVFVNSMITLIEKTTLLIDSVEPAVKPIYEQFISNCNSTKNSIRKSLKNERLNIVTLDYTSCTTEVIPALEAELERLHEIESNPDYIDIEGTTEIKKIITYDLLVRMKNVENEIKSKMN